MTEGQQAETRLQALQDIRATVLEPLQVDMDDAASAALVQVGRTEDIMFSPSGRCLAIVGHQSQQVLLLDVTSGRSQTGQPNIHLTSPKVIESAALSYPHGICWLTDEFFVIANRQGNACLFRLPPTLVSGLNLLEPELVIAAGAESLVHTPGSVGVRHLMGQWWEVVLCNNYANQLSQHLMAVGDEPKLLCSSVLLQQGLNVPDGVCFSSDGRWIAVSNHYEHAVRLYRNRPGLGPASVPDATLVGVNFPHGLRFIANDQHVVVADAGLPFVHVFNQPEAGWSGEVVPAVRVRVIDDAAFHRGHFNPEEGGPKGVDCLPGQSVLAVTNQEQPLAFFDLAPLLTSVSDATANSKNAEQTALMTMVRHLTAQKERLHGAEADALKTRHQADLLQRRLADAEQTIHALHGRMDAQAVELWQISASRSWRLMAPYRWVGNLLRRCLKRW